MQALQAHHVENKKEKTQLAPTPLFTVFIPCYNRAHTIRDALDSVLGQTMTDYEIVVVDDGSTDGTEEVVHAWSAESSAEIRYFYQPNLGKHAAHNRGVAAAKGQLFMVLDSDDVMLPNCLELVSRAWWSVPGSLREKYAGVEGLCVKSDGSLHGTRFPQDVFDSDYLEIRGRYEVAGEKRNAIRTDVLREYPYPTFPGEYHVRPDYIWKRISHKYKFRYINEVLHRVDFAPNGLTATASKRRLRNVQALHAYWHDDIAYHQKHLCRERRQRNYAEYVRYALHGGVGLSEQLREVPERGLWLKALPRALPNYLADLYKKRRYRIK